ncbi:autotransporter-associated beta strand repeat protein [Opitutaceae bacterium TAV1]|nr:autotransporter-associated beta strand repeat protein [Opitutaceae bacterium TAV1]
MKILRFSSLGPLIATAFLSAHQASADDHTWTADATGNPEWTWGDSTKWSPSEGGVPNAADANVTFTITGGSPVITLNGAYAVNNMTVTADGGRNISFNSINTAGTHSLGIGGELKKNNGSSSVSFMDYNTGRLLNLTVNTLGFTNTGGGNFYFGRNDGGRRLNSLSIANLNMGASDTAEASIRLNVTNDYSLGLVTFGGTNTKNVYLINNASNAAGYSRTATVNGLTQTAGSTAATLYGSRIASTGANVATLRIDTDAAADFTASTILVDGTGGTLAVLKTGEGKQTLSGALTYTGGTRVDEGTLAVTGSLAADGDLAVANGATFVAGAALSLHDASFESGAILGFDLGADARLSLSGDLTQDGDGPATFVIDFQNTGVFDQTYTRLLSVTGANAFEGAILSYINFGESGLSGVLSIGELTGSFSIAPIPEPSTWALMFGIFALCVAGLRHHRRS